ncbi:DUF4349 domain-containing protein [Phycicoccus flavus]|uniref:DUF4349 domain-containing protein n=1 Tax=Phycicoccus flavus TaxID=2502783 RepID=A0A8T6RBW3_9MICO|nr:DUF4349 domain-containing protein [Phycicoccus flavus]NHA69641.1 DUF4349 domain-containing protein [Phycicoccus flavus]
MRTVPALTSPRPRRRPGPSRLASAALAAALAAGLAACSADGSSDSGAAVSVADPAPAAGGPTGADGSGTDEAAGGATAKADPGSAGTGGSDPVRAVAASVADRRLARRADVSLQVTDVARAASRLRAVAQGAGGLVVAEEVSADAGDSGADDPADDVARGGWGTVTISVPAEKLDPTLDAVAELGTVLSRQTSTDDVTARYVDTTSRVASMRASVARVRALMVKADELSDVVALEGELSRRQADLEALEQQLSALEDQVALAPITVSLSTPGADTAAEDPSGFLAGLAGGWEAFTTSVRLVLTLVGALVPFAVAVALLLVPVLWWRRRRIHTVAAPPAA